MHRTVRLSVVFILGVCLLVTMQPSGTHAQSSNYTFTPLIRVGDPPPGGGEYRFSHLGLHRVNNRGDLLFGGFREVYLQQPGQIRRLAQRGEASPLGSPFALVFGSDLNDQGEVLVFSSLADQREALMLWTTEGMRPVVATGQVMPTGGQVNQIFGHGLNNRGEVAFFATLRGGSSLTGIFLSSGGEIRTIVAAGQPSPLGGVVRYTFPAVVDLNDRGDVAFEAQITGDNFPRRIFLYREGNLEALVGPGDRTPLGGQFSIARWPQINNQGQVLFEASLSGAPARDGVFVWSEGVIRKVVALGDATPLGGRFREFAVTDGPVSFLVVPVFNQQGQVAFAAIVEEGAAPVGIFLVSGEQVIPIVTLGQTTPLGGAYAGFGQSLALSDDATVAFEASLVGGSANRGLFLTHGSDAAALVTTNDVVPEGARLTGLQLDLPWTKRLALNRQGEVAFIADIAGGQGVFFGAGETIRPLARSGQVVENGDQLVEFGRVALNQAGALVFTADRVGGGRGVYLVHDGKIRRIAGPGDPSPIGGTFALADFAAINDGGQIAFHARVIGGLAEEGIFLADGDELRAVVTTAQTPPVQGRFTRFGGLDLNNQGQVAFVGLLQVEGALSPQRGLFVATGEIKKIALTGDPLSSGGQIASFGDSFSDQSPAPDEEPLDRPALNQMGAVSFWTSVEVGNALSEAIVLHTDEGLRTIAAQGAASPLGGQYLSFLPAFPAINRMGEVAFRTVARRGSGATAGVVVAAQDGRRVVARSFQGTPLGGAFRDFSPVQINDDGVLLFEASLQNAPISSALFLAQPPQAP